VQLGIRGPTAGPQDYTEALKLGARMMTREELHRRDFQDVLQEIHAIVGGRRTYIMLDIDVIDPAFAPSTGTSEIEGLSKYDSSNGFAVCVG